MDKKNILIILLIIIIVFIIVYYEKKDNKKTLKKEDVSYIETTDKDINNLIKNITNINGDFCSSNVFFSKKIVNSIDVDNKSLYEITLNNLLLDYNKKSDVTQFGIKEIKKERFDYWLNKLFIKNNFKYKDYDTCPKYDFDKVNNIYKFNDSECVNTCSNYFIRVSKVIKLNNKLNIYIRVIFNDNDKGGERYYKDLKKENELKFDTFNNDYYLGSLYNFEFKNINNNYVFVKSKLED